MDIVHNSPDSKRSCVDRRANLFLSLLLMLVVIVGGINIIALMMEGQEVRINEHNRGVILDKLERTVEKNAELNGRYDDLVRKHDELVRTNSEVIRRYVEVLGRYETALGNLGEYKRSAHGERPERP